MFQIEDTLVLLIDYQVRLLPSICNYEQLEAQTAVFIKGCRILELPVLTMQQYTKGLGDTSDKLKEALGDFSYIEKISFSCCGNAEFMDKLNKSGKKNILVAGIEAHICVQQTVLDLLEKGLNVQVAADCIGSRKDTDRIYAQKRMRDAGAVITTAETALFELLKAADHPKRKEISNLVK